MAAPLSGRRAQAARNDRRIIEAARDVFTADPNAPIADVAERAGVGIGALYRRYRSKEELLQRLSLDGLRRYIAAAEAALAEAAGDGDPWAAFAGFLRRCLDEGAGSLTLRFAGSFATTDELNRLGREAYGVTQRLLDHMKLAGGLRPDIEVGDISLLIEQLQAIQVRDSVRAGQLRRRYLALLLVALHAPAEGPLPGPAPRWEEIANRYDT